LHTREIARYGGLVHNMPKYAFVFMLFTLANVGLPGTSGFIGEFLSLLGGYQANTWVGLLATTGIVLSAAYALWLYRKVIFGELTKADLLQLIDLSPREIATFAPLVFAALWLGIDPTPVLNMMAASVHNLIEQHQAALAASHAILAAH